MERWGVQGRSLVPWIPREAMSRRKVCDWPEHDRTLQQRGSLTVWVAPDALAAWQPPRAGQRGRPRDRFNVTIGTKQLRTWAGTCTGAALGYHTNHQPKIASEFSNSLVRSTDRHINRPTVKTSG